LAEFKILPQNPAALTPRSGNPRTHSEKQLRQIADSIRTFGFTNPILVDHDNGIVAGHGRVEAAKRLKLESVPTIRLEDMTEAEIRAYVIADNRLAENAGWDRELLAIELQHLYELDLDFDVTTTGFEMPEIDVLFGELQAGESDSDKPDPGDEVPDVDESVPAVTRLGDLWRALFFAGLGAFGAGVAITIVGLSFKDRAHIAVSPTHTP
jgi:ParB-like chromosome segregation protein Spo0J